MEENVALDSKKQKKFDKSIKGIKKLLKKNEAKPHKPAVLAPKDEESKGDKKKRKRPERGLVYLSHIPHGFYEHEMTQYFKQFGMVTNVRVIRSPRTGRSKGFAFVEFREPTVAEIVAETMNNYLMGKRLIKAAIIPPEKQRHRAFRKHWSSQHNPTADRRVKERKAHNSVKTDEKHLRSARKILSHLAKTKKKLTDLGINYDFFKPVDVPEALLQKVKTESEKPVTQKNVAEEKANKKKKTKVEEPKEKVAKDNKSEPKQTKSTDKKTKKEVKKVKDSDKVVQNEKQMKMKDAGVKLPENFIKIAPESGEDSDSSLDFDSDEYEKMLEDDSDASSGDEIEDGDECGDGSDDEESEEDMPQLVPIKQKKGKKPIVAQPPPKKEAKPVAVPKVQKPQPPQPKPPKKGPKQPDVAQGQKIQKPPVQQQGVKRKEPQTEVSHKKPKFEKKDKPRNKQFKKKNKA